MAILPADMACAMLAQTVNANCSRWVIAALVVLPAIFAAQIARADVIYSNFGPSDSYDQGLGWSVFSFQQVAMPFTVAGGDYLLTSVEVAFNTGDIANTQIQLLLMSDAGGVPGAVIETFLVDVFAGSFITLGTSILQPTLLDGTTYWIATDSSNDPGFSGVWASTFPVAFGDFAYTTGFNQPWINLGAVNQPLGAFRVIGSPLSATEIPEPASLALWSLAGAAGVAVWRRRRRL